jgi:hypothetical protein
MGYSVFRQLGKLPILEWFYDDFVRFQEDGGQGALHIGEAADKHRWRIWHGSGALR